jgi:hypothetical protein
MLDTKYITNPYNNPSQVVINGVQLPQDTITILDGEKVISESKILDGVALYERVSRKPFDIDFNFTIRSDADYTLAKAVNKTITQQSQSNFSSSTAYEFPQKAIEGYFSQIWNLDQVVPVINTLLNGIGIKEIIIKKITITTIRGTTSVNGTIKCLENYGDNKGGTLIIK